MGREVGASWSSGLSSALRPVPQPPTAVSKERQTDSGKLHLQVDKPRGERGQFTWNFNLQISAELGPSTKSDSSSKWPQWDVPDTAKLISGAQLEKAGSGIKLNE